MVCFACSCLSHLKVVRRLFPEPFHRNVLGGCLFVIAKVSHNPLFFWRDIHNHVDHTSYCEQDVANLMYRYEKVRQKQSRRIQEYR